MNYHWFIDLGNLFYAIEVCKLDQLIYGKPKKLNFILFTFCFDMVKMIQDDYCGFVRSLKEAINKYSKTGQRSFLLKNFTWSYQYVEFKKSL